MIDTRWLAYVLVTLLAFVSVSRPASAVTPDQDFANRCAAAGVLYCQGFNNNTDLNVNDGSSGAAGYQLAGCGNVQRGFIDTNVKVSGAGSLRFTIPTIAHCADVAGKYDLPLGCQFGNLAQFPSNCPDLYIQYRYRVSGSYLSNDVNHWMSSMKITDIYGHSSTCQSDEFTVIWETISGTTPAHQVIDWYNDCGNGYPTDPATNLLYVSCNDVPTGGGNCLAQQGSTTGTGTGIGFNCAYQDGATDNVPNGNTHCFVPLPNQWITMYYHLHPGTPGGADGTVDAWETGPDGHQYRWQRVAGRSGVSIWATGGQNGFVDRMYFSPYMTEYGKGQGNAPSIVTYVWFDELIVSTQAIAAPTGLAPANPTSPAAH